MTPEQQQRFDTLVTELAGLLYEDAQANEMSMETLGEIEQTVRSQIQQHLSPQLGIFLSTVAWEKTQEPPAN